MSIECGKVICQKQFNFVISCNFCLIEFTKMQIFTSHFRKHHNLATGESLHIKEEISTIFNAIEDDPLEHNDELNIIDIKDENCIENEKNSPTPDETEINNVIETNLKSKSSIIENHSSEPSNENHTKAKESFKNSEDFGFECPLCKKIFKMKAKLDVHHRRVHLKEKRFKCSQCEKRFFENCDRLSHEKIHTKKHYSCEICKKTFSSSLLLKFHKEKTHFKNISSFTENENYSNPPFSEDNSFTALGNFPKIETSELENQSQYNYNKTNQNIAEPTNDANLNYPFQCPYPSCDKIFKFKSKLIVHHKRVHLKEKNFKCNFCDKKFFDNYDRLIHENTHTKEKIEICEICENSFSSVRSLRSHKEKNHSKEKDKKIDEEQHYNKINKLIDHNGKKKYKTCRTKHSNAQEWTCNICEKKLLLTNAQKRLHIRKHEESNLKCSIINCKEYFKNQDQLNKHIDDYHSNNPEFPFKCPLCKKLFKMKTKLNVHHKRVHLKIKRFGCNYCDKKFFDNCDRIIHENTHTKENCGICEICGNSFSSIKSLSSHKRKIHGENLSDIDRFKTGEFDQNHKTQKNKIYNFDVGNWTCNICEKTLIVSKAQKRLHLRKHEDCPLKCSFTNCKEYFKNQNQIDKHVELYHSDNPDLPFKCHICNRLFKMKIKLDVHHKRVHLKEKRFKCSFCEKSFFENYGKMLHEITHSKEKLYVCELCGKRLSTSKCLRAHRIREHSEYFKIEQKQFSCKTCGKIFKRKEYLKSHTALHSGEKKFLCNICSSSFTWASALRRHMNVHNEERDFVCKICGKDFTSKLRITCHMKSHGLPFLNENVFKKSEILKNP